LTRAHLITQATSGSRDSSRLSLRGGRDLRLSRPDRPRSKGLENRPISSVKGERLRELTSAGEKCRETPGCKGLNSHSR